ncbi:hypothetical protein [Pseudomonas viridiflava]|uniref:hypothetical protein n=1 Tax=Pseudomonas viridiflava TaxID=33069 RepID=UPI0013CEB4A8|nr:hypothetical protein [Pseudomonas viridiflava]QXG48638.1 hypothetical protein KTT57_06255 [Pseudomonas viridiflava]
MSSPSSTTIPVPFFKEAKTGRNDTEDSMNFKSGQKAKITGVLLGSNTELPTSKIYTFV